ncbi:DUF4399 domain-containing protein [Methylobacterium trifolii]|uniref:DUF4399 domain-containing protein n=1 Tax=Methylobacterium trifolii TaxID=1003092 RepID=A0ABQ4U5N8_9HYPH|nr:DUF4399 domain-containing protein [Methylobacterium trifolii]GJE61440.1 hypothetical protein MPOCJGCO_3562 [Methylobacterium trifolii]
MRRGMAWSALALLFLGVPAGAQTPAPAPERTTPPPPVTPPPDSAVYLIAPRAGSRVTSPVTVQFGLRNMGVTQAGSTARNAGHHHLLVDVKDDLTEGEPIPADRNHLHFGGGQTETRLDLPAGRHTLQLVLGDAQHRPFSPSVRSAKVEILVVSPQANRRRRPPRGRYHYGYGRG